MELALVAWRSTHTTRALMVWSYLVCFSGSMRFNDQLHTMPSSLRMRVGGLEDGERKQLI